MDAGTVQSTLPRSCKNAAGNAPGQGEESRALDNCKPKRTVVGWSGDDSRSCGGGAGLPRPGCRIPKVGHFRNEARLTAEEESVTSSLDRERLSRRKATPTWPRPSQPSGGVFRGTTRLCTWPPSRRHMPAEGEVPTTILSGGSGLSRRTSIFRARKVRPAIEPWLLNALVSMVPRTQPVAAPRAPLLDYAPGMAPPTVLPEGLAFR